MEVSAYESHTTKGIKKSVAQVELPDTWQANDGYGMLMTP